MTWRDLLKFVDKTMNEGPVRGSRLPPGHTTEELDRATMGGNDRKEMKPHPFEEGTQVPQAAPDTEENTREA